MLSLLLRIEGALEKTDSALAAGFSSVLVIMFALHAKGPRFKTE